MGCGKSTLGKRIAQKQNMAFVDLDSFIEQREGQTISTLFDRHGELVFRQREQQALHFLMNEHNHTVISLGGGTPCYYDNMKQMCQSPHHTVYIKAQIPTLVNRLWLEKEKRPLIAHLADKETLAEFVGKHLFERQQFYMQAQSVIAVDGKSVDAIVADILEKLA